MSLSFMVTLMMVVVLRPYGNIIVALVGMEITTATMAVDSEVKGWHSIIVKVFCRFLSTLDT